MPQGPDDRAPLSRRVSLGWFSLTTVAFWLPTIRGAFDGASYQWGLFGLGGRGTGGDYWLPLVASLVAIALTAGAWRGQRWALWLVAAWSLLLTLAFAVFMATSPEDLRFRGDTLGIDVSLGWVGLIVLVGATLLTLVSATQAPSSEDLVPPPSSLNGTWLGALALALPIQFVLLRLGAPGSSLDQAGVVLTVVQWFLIGRIFAPRR